MIRPVRAAAAEPPVGPPLVLHVLPRTAGGLGRHVAWVARGCRDAWRPVLAGPGAADAGAVADIWRGGLGSALRQLRPALVHAHGYRAAARARLALVAGGSRTPLVATAHTLPPGPLAPRAAGSRCRWLAVSHGVAARLAAAGVDEGRLWVLPPACAPVRSLEAASARAELGLAGAAPVLAALGRLVPDKGFDVLLRALALLPPPIALLLGGEGPERGRLAWLARDLGLGARVRSLGRLDDTAPLWAAADLAVVPSRREGLGLAALEALSAGRPVVASAVGGLPDAVRHGQTGWLVPPGDPLALAAAVAGLLADPPRRGRMAEAAKGEPDRRGPPALAAAVAAVYAEALGLRRPPVRRR